MNSPLSQHVLRESFVGGSTQPSIVKQTTVKPPIKDTLKEDKPPNKGQAESTLVYTLYGKKSPLKEDSLSTKDKTADPISVLIKRFHCILIIIDF